MHKSSDTRNGVDSKATHLAHLQFVNDAGVYVGEVANNLNVADEANPGLADAHSELGCAQVDYDLPPECEQEMEASDTFEEDMQIEFEDYVASLEDNLSSRGAWDDKDEQEDKDNEEIGGPKKIWLEWGREDRGVKGDQRAQNLRDGEEQREDPTHFIESTLVEEDEVEEDESGQDTSECEFEEDEERESAGGEQSADDGSPLTWRKLRWTKEESPMLSWRKEGSPLRLLNSSRPLKAGQAKPDGEDIGEQCLHTKPESRLLYNCDTGLFYRAPCVETNANDEDRCETKEDINGESNVSHEEKDHETKVQGIHKMENEEIITRSNTHSSESIPFAEEVVKYIFDHILDDVFNRNFDVTTEDQELDSNNLGGELKAGVLEVSLEKVMGGEGGKMKGENENEGSKSPLHDSLGRVLLSDWWEEFLQSRSVVNFCVEGKCSLFSHLLFLLLKEW